MCSASTLPRHPARATPARPPEPRASRARREGASSQRRSKGHADDMARPRALMRVHQGSGVPACHNDGGRAGTSAARCPASRRPGVAWPRARGTVRYRRVGAPRTHARTMLCASAMRAASSNVSPSGDDLHAHARGDAPVINGPSIHPCMLPCLADPRTRMRACTPGLAGASCPHMPPCPHATLGACGAGGSEASSFVHPARGQLGTCGARVCAHACIHPHVTHLAACTRAPSSFSASRPQRSACCST